MEGGNEQIFGWCGVLPSIPQYGKPYLPHWENFPLPLNAINTSGLRHYIKIRRFQVQTLLGAQPGFRIQPRYEAHGDPLVEISHAVTNIRLVRLPLQQWPKCGYVAAK